MGDSLLSVSDNKRSDAGSPFTAARAEYLKADTEEGGRKDISMKRGILQRSS